MTQINESLIHAITSTALQYDFYESASFLFYWWQGLVVVGCAFKHVLKEPFTQKCKFFHRLFTPHVIPNPRLYSIRHKRRKFVCTECTSNFFYYHAIVLILGLVISSFKNRRKSITCALLGTEIKSEIHFQNENWCHCIKTMKVNGKSPAMIEKQTCMCAFL